MKSWRIFLWVAVVVVTLWFLWSVRGVLLPFVLAWLTAVLLEPVILKLKKLGLPRPAAVMLISLLFFGSILGIGLVIGPRIGKQINDVRSSVQSLAQRLAEESADDNPFVRWNPSVIAKPAGPLGAVDSTLATYRGTLDQVGLPSTRRAFTAQFVDPYRENISQSLQKAFNGFVALLGGMFSQVVLLAFTPLFAMFLMMDLEMFRARFGNWIPPAIRREVMNFLEDVGDVFQNYLRGVMVNISLYMTVQALMLALLGVPYSYLLAFIAGCLYLIPNLGGLISALIIVVATGTSGVRSNFFMELPNSWWFAGIVMICFTVITTTWDIGITPRVVGKAVKLHPFVGMFVVFCGGALFGILGMMLAYPVAGVVKIILERVLNYTNKPVGKGSGLPAVPLRHKDEITA